MAQGGSIARFTLWYFALVFGAGFALGVLRTLLLEPRVGAQTAELLELPLMVLVSAWAAAFCLRRLGAGLGRSAAAGAGVAAVILLLGFELVVVLLLRGEPLGGWLATRASPAGVAWGVAVLLFGVWPWLLHPRVAAGRGLSSPRRAD